MDLDSITINVLPTRDCGVYQGLMFLAQTIQVDSANYNIFICDSPYLKDKDDHWQQDAIIHEIVHIWQMKNKMLIQRGDTVIWNGVAHDIWDVAYNKRGWELDAILRTEQLKQQIHRRIN